jgi:hypothetical protein
MAGHPDVDVYLQAMFAGRTHKGIAEELVIRIGGEDDLPIIAALDDVLGLAWHDVAGKAGHDMPRKVNTGQFRGIFVSDPIYLTVIAAQPQKRNLPVYFQRLLELCSFLPVNVSVHPTAKAA